MLAQGLRAKPDGGLADGLGDRPSPVELDKKRVLRHSQAEELAPQRIFDRVARPISPDPA